MINKYHKSLLIFFQTSCQKLTIMISIILFHAYFCIFNLIVIETSGFQTFENNQYTMLRSQHFVIFGSKE